MSWKLIRKITIQAVIIVVFSTAVAVGVNALRPEPLAWVAAVPYEIFVDCPESLKTANEISPKEALEAKVLFVDARDGEAFAQSHIRNAFNVPYDPLFSVEDTVVSNLKTQRAAFVVVYGDEQTGKMLADELASAGLARVRFVAGGMQALKEAGADVETQEVGQ